MEPLVRAAASDGGGDAAAILTRLPEDALVLVFQLSVRASEQSDKKIEAEMIFSQRPCLRSLRSLTFRCSVLCALRSDRLPPSLPPSTHASLCCVCRRWYHYSSYTDIFATLIARRIRYWMQWMNEQTPQQQT